MLFANGFANILLLYLVNSLGCCFQGVVAELPVNAFPEGLQVVWASVLVVQVVSVFPNVAGQNWYQRFCNWALCVATSPNLQ